MAGEYMEEWKWAQHDVGARIQDIFTDPAIIDHARIAVLRNLWHARGSTSVEIGRDPIPIAVLKLQGFGLLVQFGVETQNLGAVSDRVLRADERNDPALRGREIAQQIDFKNCVHIGRHR